jgi:ABC-type amino acid transport substrate-binding protein
MLSALVAGQARSLQDIIDRHAFTICVHPGFSPYSTREPKPGGLQIDLGRAVAEQLGVELKEEWVLFRRDARQVGCDAIMAGIAPDQASAGEGASETRPTTGEPVRETAAAPGPVSSKPYAASVTRVVMRADAPPVSSIEELKGKSIAVLHASYTHYLLDRRGIPVRTRYPTEADILEAVDSGEMEAGIVNEWSLGWYRKTHSNARLQAVDGLVIDPELDFNVAIVLRNVDQALLTKINAIVVDLITAGTMARIFRDYGIDYRPPLVH